MADVKTYSIRINGINESVRAIDALNDALAMLEKRIYGLEQKTIKINTSFDEVKTSSKTSSTLSARKEEDKLLKQIQKTEQDIANTQREEYQRMLASKDLLKQQVDLQKQRAAQERLIADEYGNTMAGMKQQLADLKEVINNTDINAEGFENLVKKADELNAKLLEIEKQYGQFGRNVGNYKTAAEGFGTLKLTINGVVREFSSAREASRTLKNELDTLAASGKNNTKEYEELDKVYKRLKSTMNDVAKSSTAMDQALDTVQSFVSIASVGKGLSSLFGFDNAELEQSIQKLLALQNILNGIEKIRLQMKTQEGLGKWLSKGSEGIDKFVNNLFGLKTAEQEVQASANAANTALNAQAATATRAATSTRAATVAAKGLSLALKAISGIGLGLAISFAIEGLTKLIESFKKTSNEAGHLDEALKVLKKSQEEYNEVLSEANLRGVISDEVLVAAKINVENQYIQKQIQLLKERWKLMKESTGFTSNYVEGEKFEGPVTYTNPVQKFTINNIKELEDLFGKLSVAVSENKDYFDKWGEGVSGWIKAVFTSVDDTKKAMDGLATIKIGDFIGRFDELQKNFKQAQISTAEYQKGLSELKAELMDDSGMLKTVYLNLENYIHDEKVREQIQSIIDKVYDLEDAFNHTRAETVRRWAQVEIDAMADGINKTLKQIKLNEQAEIDNYAKTENDIALIKAKYDRQRLNAQKQHNEQAAAEAKQNAQKRLAAERDLEQLRLEALEDGWEKERRKLELEQKQRRQQIIDDGIKVNERLLALDELYQKKFTDARKQFFDNLMNQYRKFWNDIYNFTTDSLDKQLKIEILADENSINKLKDRLNQLGGVTYPLYENQNYTRRQIDAIGIEDTPDTSKEVFENRLEAVKDYWDKRLKLTKENAKKIAAAEKALEEKRHQDERREIINWNDERQKEVEDYYTKALANDELNAEERQRLEKEKDDAIERIANEHFNRLEQAQIEHAQNMIKIDEDQKEKSLDESRQYYDDLMTQYRDYSDRISDLSEKVIEKNIFGIDLKKTIKNFKETRKVYTEFVDAIAAERQRLSDAYAKGEVDFDTFSAKMQEMDEMLRSFAERIKDLNWNQIVGEVAKTLNTVFQLALQSAQTIMQAYEDLEDYQYNKQKEYLEKQIDLIETKLREQEEIIRKHSQNVNAIESELSSARGDRRQELIDRLNEEKRAQREALEEQKRQEKEKEKLEKEQEKLERQRKEQEYKRTLANILISTAMASANGLATQPFWPVGVAMGALATTLGMIQYNLAKKQRPYAKGGQLEGGVIQGPRHSNGGVKVLGGRAEVEGGEFITNRISTFKNVELLEYINSKHKRLTLEDMIDYYEGGVKIRRNVNSLAPRSKFATGGMIPSNLNTSATSQDRILQAIENYSNRPQYVQVVDIIDRMDEVNHIKVLAGLS